MSDLPLYAFPFMTNNIWPTATALQDIRLRNLGGLGFEIFDKKTFVKNRKLKISKNPKQDLCGGTTEEKIQEKFGKIQR